MREWFKQWVGMWKELFKRKEKPAPIPVPEPETDPVTPSTSCSCNTSGPLREPHRGEECPVPFGRDIRFLAWSPGKKDWVFIGYHPASCSYANGIVTGNCFIKDGVTYHYLGWKAPSSSGTLHEERSGKYQTTYRLYYEAR